MPPYNHVPKVVHRASYKTKKLTISWTQILRGALIIMVGLRAMTLIDGTRRLMWKKLLWEYQQGHDASTGYLGYLRILWRRLSV